MSAEIVPFDALDPPKPSLTPLSTAFDALGVAGVARGTLSPVCGAR
jgi:hypothetical protein